MSQTDAEALQSLVEELTLSGLPVLNDSKMRRIKKLCKRSETNVAHLFSLVTTQLAKQHAEIRLSAFLIIDHIFRRSHLFRTLMTKHLKTYLELVFEVEPSNPLPPPKEAATTLKTKAILAMDEWNGVYGFAYKRLSLAHHYLKTCHKVDFGTVTAQHRVHEDLKRKREALRVQQRRERLERTRAEIEESMSEAEEALKELENGLNILVPDITDPRGDLKFDEKDFDVNDDGHDDHDDAFRRHGIGASYALELDLSQAASAGLKETEDNADVIRRLDEVASDVKRRHLKKIKNWLKSLTKNEGTQSEIVAVVNLKERLDTFVSKYDGLNIERLSEPAPEESEESEDEFEDVLDADEKEGYEPVIPPHMRKEYGLNTDEFKPEVKPSSTRPRRLVTAPTDKRHLDESDPTCHLATVKKLKASGALANRAGASSSSEKRPVAGPSNARVVPYDKDLYYLFENPDVPEPMVDRNESLHRFWTPRQDTAPESFKPENYEAGLKMRKMHFTGTFVPVQHKCNVAMPNGKLCPRMDRVKCPFHGVIIPRDAKGLPLEQDRRKKEVEAREKKERKMATQEEEEGTEEQRPWMDLELIADIEAQTGRDLGSKFIEKKLRKESGKKGKGKGKKSKPDSNLTNVKASRDTVRSRLEKKIFNKSTMKRVNAALNDMDKRKIAEKFGEQFNYL